MLNAIRTACHDLNIDVRRVGVLLRTTRNHSVVVVDGTPSECFELEVAVRKDVSFFTSVDVTSVKTLDGFAPLVVD
ncbi:MAG: hypothetical protein M0R22_13325 [Dehalococcoidia bacterium]|jgi:hypothetical protein|nr:hypothetical protein [Dehalococcoidia bacterium]